ncbi:hypothetical protein THF1C08_1520003 [Vibrio jasicida]|nr:hypothetical protein THF1C08_1520003 [Vibrio jasicida]
MYPIIVCLRAYIAEPNRPTFPAMSEKWLCDQTIGRFPVKPYIRTSTY